MRVSKDLILREVAGEYILIPVGKAALKIHGMINLTESAVFLWKKLQEDCTEEELVQALLKEYDIDRETAAADVRELIEQMQKIGVIE